MARVADALEKDFQAAADAVFVKAVKRLVEAVREEGHAKHQSEDWCGCCGETWPCKTAAALADPALAKVRGE